MSNLVADIVARAHAGDYDALVEAVPYAKWLGLHYGVTEGHLVGTMAYADHLIGNPLLPALHGGTLGALLESTAIFEILWRHKSALPPKTINVTIEYLRSARPVDTFAAATITKAGRRVVAVRAEAWQDDRNRPVALASARFLVMASDA